MDFEKFKGELIAERERIDAILEVMSTAPAKNSTSYRQPTASPAQPKRRMTQAAKNKIAAAQRASWAKRRKKAHVAHNNNKAKAA